MTAGYANLPKRSAYGDQDGEVPWGEGPHRVLPAGGFGHILLQQARVSKLLIRRLQASVATQPLTSLPPSENPIGHQRPHSWPRPGLDKVLPMRKVMVQIEITAWRSLLATCWSHAQCGINISPGS